MQGVNATVSGGLEGGHEKQGEEGGGGEIETLVSKNQVREAWIKTQRWYQEAKGHQVPPTSEQLNKTSTLREDFYR